MSDTVQTFDDRAVVNEWGRSLGNGKTALIKAHQAVEHVRTTGAGDTTILSKMIAKARAKGDEKAAADLSFLVRQIWDGARATKDKNDNPVIKIKGCAVSNSAVDTLAELVREGVSMRGPKFRKAFKSEDDNTDADFDAKAAAERWAKRHAKKEALAFIAALQQQVKSM